MAISLYEECASKMFKTDTPSQEQTNDAKRIVFGVLFGCFVSHPIDEETRRIVVDTVTARTKERNGFGSLAGRPLPTDPVWNGTPVFSGVRTGRWVNKEIYPCKVGVSSFIKSLKHYKDREDKDASS